MDTTGATGVSLLPSQSIPVARNPTVMSVEVKRALPAHISYATGRGDRPTPATLASQDCSLLTAIMLSVSEGICASTPVRAAITPPEARARPTALVPSALGGKGNADV